jgi:Arc/MetJ family transcription regulator
LARTTIDVDEKACAAVMRSYRLKTKREAINFRYARLRSSR